MHHQTIVVRKILSEALIAVHWDRNGVGVMLPPFAKASRQADFLIHLPDAVRRFFPRVFNVIEREIPVLSSDGEMSKSYKEVIYEMSFVPGEEVSRFVERASPHPAVVAKLYEQILLVLANHIHPLKQVASRGDTIEVSYFKKIESRLALCRQTAPQTFGSGLLDTETILINGQPYLNHAALLRSFRQNPLFMSVLEPRFHCLVMGDTNTENIKITDIAPLVAAQNLIDAGAPQCEIDVALVEITAEKLGIMLLDPRAIGYESDGRDTVDDAMYDNKPWHNSIGHYDEIHFEHFRMDTDIRPGSIPQVNIAFTPGNPFQNAYRVRDVTEHGLPLDDGSHSEGMEAYFSRVMAKVYDLDNPASHFLKNDPNWLTRFVFIMGTHFAAMPPFHFRMEHDGSLVDSPQVQRRPIAIYCEGIKWLNWALQMLNGTRSEFLGIGVPKVSDSSGQELGHIGGEWLR